jgi:hypothetical protein
MSTTNETPRRARLLTRLRINEVSAVDRGAGEGVKIVLMKRGDEPPPDARSKGPLEKWERAQRREAERREFEERERLIQGRERGAELFKHYLAKAEVAADRDVSEDPKHAPTVEHHASKVADLLVETGRHPNRAAALDHLLHSARGAALLRRVHKHHEEEPTMTPEQIEAARVEKFKSLNPVAVAKVIVDDGKSYGITEPELVELISNYDRQPGETAAKCFSRHYEAQDENGLAVRKAVQIAKDMMSLEPTFVGAEDARDVNGATKAYNQLMQMAEEQRARAPWKTVAQLFSELMQDPKNSELASKAHQRPTATTQYPFPRT